MMMTREEVTALVKHYGKDQTLEILRGQINSTEAMLEKAREDARSERT